MGNFKNINLVNFRNFENYSLNFSNNVIKTRGDLLNLDSKTANYKDTSSVYNSLFEDFYLTDSLRLSSNRMRRCSSLNRKRTTNFFK